MEKLMVQSISHKRVRSQIFFSRQTIL